MNKNFSTALDIDETLAKCERRLERVILNAEEAMKADLLVVLRDLESARMEIVRPAAGDKRCAARFRDQGLITVVTPQGANTGGVLDISSGGAILELDEASLLPDTCRLELPGLRSALEAEVLSQKEREVRLRFRPMTAETTLELVKYLERHLTRY